MPIPKYQNFEDSQVDDKPENGWTEEHGCSSSKKQKLTISYKSTYDFNSDPKSQIQVVHINDIKKFKDFDKIIDDLHSSGAHLAGICKIVPPKSYKPNDFNGDYSMFDEMSFEVYEQKVSGEDGAYNLQRWSHGNQRIDEYRKLAESNRYGKI